MNIAIEGLEIIIVSDSDYDELVAEIYKDGVFVALISQDKGKSQPQIVFPDGNLLDVSWLLKAISKACDQLLTPSSVPLKK